jgi:primosomal protein N'
MRRSQQLHGKLGWRRAERSWQSAASRCSAPAPPLVARVKNRFREQMLLKGAISQSDKDAVLGAFRDLTGKGRGRSSIDLRWDVDPEMFL